MAADGAESEVRRTHPVASQRGGQPVRLICIEEHAIDPVIENAAQPVLQREAPYMALLNSGSVASQPRTGEGRS